MLLRPLNEVLQLHYLLVLATEREEYLVVLVAQPRNHHLLLLKAFLDDSHFLGVRKRILAADHFLQLGAQARAFIDVELHLDFNLGDLGGFDVALKGLHLVGLGSDLALKLSNLALEVRSEVGFNLELGLLGVALGGTVGAGGCSYLVGAGILLEQEVINEFLFLTQL